MSETDAEFMKEMAGHAGQFTQFITPKDVERLLALARRGAEAAAEIDRAYERAARIADTGMLVPPDGGSPTEGECDVATGIAAAIRALKQPSP